MNSYRFISVLFLVFSLLISINSQDGPVNTFCGTSDTIAEYNGPIGATTLDVVFIFLDFPDGRLSNGEIPSTDTELNQVGNIDAVLNMGFNTTNSGATYFQKARKYTYDDFWNMYFSVNTFIGSAHPDWESHGSNDYPPDGDTARAFGSFKEYFSEVSYGKLNINPGITRSNGSGMYSTGIVNRIIEINGTKYIRPIKFHENKSHYFRDSDEHRAFNEMLSAAPSLVSELHNLPPSHPEYIEFDIENFSGKVVFVFAGGTGGYGGLAGVNGKYAIVREKRNKNNSSDDKGKIVNGLTIYCHEFGHLIGFTHTRIGNYCVMSEGTSNQNCPSHLSISYKLKAGWIDPQYIRFVTSSQNIPDLPPSIYHGDCAIITIYGKAGYSETAQLNFNHSEYYIIENRRMMRADPNIRFDKKFVWQTDRMPDAENVGFNGGCLITHYSSYNSFGGIGIKIINADGEIPVSDNDEGHSNHFFGVQVMEEQIFTFLTDNDGSEDRTKSSFDLKTGIRLTNIIDPGNGKINFSLNYGLGAPPVYDKVLYGQNLPDPFVMNGTYFLHTQTIVPLRSVGSNTNIQAGTIIEAVNGGLLYNNDGNSGNFTANGSILEPIIFRGAGFPNYRLNFTQIEVNNQDNNSSETVVLENCNFMSPVPEFMFSIINKNSSKSVILENININGGGTASFSIDNSQSNLSINELNFASSEKKIIFSSTTNNINHASITQFENSDFDEYRFSGTWRLDLPSDLIINQNKKLFVSGTTGFKNEIYFTTPFKTIINGEASIIGEFSTNRDLQIGLTGTLLFKSWDRIGSPSMDNYVRFDPGYGILCSGGLSASSVKDSLIFSVNGTGQWNGITCENSGDIILNNIKVRNAETGISISNPAGIVDIQNSRFSDNQQHDILIDNLPQSFTSARLIKNNIFTGNPNKISGLTCSNGVNLLIESNQFDNDYSNGISLLYMTDPNLISNVFSATLTSGYTPYGIYAYSSGGFYSCNNITNYSSGMKLNNSSPFIYNNDIYNNGVGLYLENASIPFLSPAFSPIGTLYTGGYNRIFNNLNEEIYCANSNIFIPTSLPLLDYGHNSIYDQNSDCLLDLGMVGYYPTYTHYMRDNYWGGGSPENRLCGSNVEFVFEPYLQGEPEPPGLCLAVMELSDNSSMSPQTLLLGSAIIDDYNNNSGSAIVKYKDLIDPANNAQYSFLALSKIFYSVSRDQNPDFYALENYYSSLSALHSLDTLFSRRSSSNSTLSDVEQPSYPEAIGEYQSVIENPINETERHYAYIDQLRTFRLMLDSLLNGLDNGAMNSGINDFQLKNAADRILNQKVLDKGLKDSKSETTKKNYNKNAEYNSFVSTVTENDKNTQLSKIRKSLDLENISFANLSNNERIKILNNLIVYKLFEISILSDSHNNRPLDRMSYQKKSKTTTNNLPVVFKLYQNYPNPFNPISRIKYDIPKQSQVQIKIFDILGREVTTLINDLKEPGFHEISFDGSNYSSGVYFYRIEAGSFTEVKKMVLLK